jgi:hypothetical protein
MVAGSSDDSGIVSVIPSVGSSYFTPEQLVLVTCRCTFIVVFTYAQIRAQRASSGFTLT